MGVENLKLFHREIMEEEGIKLSELPEELQKRIKGFDLMLKKLEKNPDDEKTFIMLQKNSVKIGDAIQNFIETDYEEDDDSDDNDGNDDNDDNDDNDNKGDNDGNDKKGDKKESEKSKENSDSNKKDDKKPSQEDTENKKPQRQSSGKFGNLMMEKKILSIMDARGEKRIRISDLESIIGREPDYPEQEVNNIKLRKVFLSSEYRLV